MIDFYLKFASEAEANSVLYTVTPAVLDEEGNVVSEETTTPNYRNIDVLGTLYEKPPIPLPEDYAPVALDGWHVNVRVVDGEDGTPLESFKVNPEPLVWRRVWA